MAITRMFCWNVDFPYYMQCSINDGARFTRIIMTPLILQLPLNLDEIL